MRGKMHKNIVIKLLVFTFCFMGIVTNANAVKLKSHQVGKLELVKRVALKYPNRKGETFEQTAMSICLTETYAGKVKIGDVPKKNPNIFSSSLGIMQVRLKTARFIAKKLNLKDVKKMSDIELVNKLLGDDEFNATIAVRYLVWLSDHTQDYFSAVSRYNGGNINYPYFNRVMSNLKKIKNETVLVD